MWKPMEIFLYDWWPIRAEATLADRVSVMPVRISYKPDGKADAWQSDWPVTSPAARTLETRLTDGSRGRSGLGRRHLSALPLDHRQRIQRVLPPFAPIGYVNSPVTRRIEPDPERAPIITKLFEWYATGNVSLKALTQKAAAAGLTNRANGKPLVRLEIHQLLQNPIYSGDFMWLDRMYEGQHKPLVSRDLFERVQRVFVAANHPPHGTKRQHSFVGLVKCALCGCSFTAELKKGLYVYYTGDWLLSLDSNQEPSVNSRKRQR
jgi:hypothetical protein